MEGCRHNLCMPELLAAFLCVACQNTTKTLTWMLSIKADQFSKDAYGVLTILTLHAKTVSITLN